MSSIREMRLRIRSIKSIAQVTRALEAVSASKVRQATQMVNATHPYAEKAWKVLLHLVRQPGHTSLHPLLTERAKKQKALIILVTSDRGLAGAYNNNILRYAFHAEDEMMMPVDFIAVGRKGRDLLIRRRKNVIAEFSQLPTPTTFMDVSYLGRLVVDDYLNGTYDQIFIAFTEFHTLAHQQTVIRKLLPLEVTYANDGEGGYNVTHHRASSVFTYEPDDRLILDQIIPRFTAIQIYQSILSAQASEHAARMVAMRNSTDNAYELTGMLQLEYNKLRQSMITSELLDIVGGSEALVKSNS
ncbi:MAG: ATP synthase F1 subunit gamma [Anaerolineae bacterium]|nr:ATP synthase F1 subunit gamma [Anaerolineae bacterium]